MTYKERVQSIADKMARSVNTDNAGFGIEMLNHLSRISVAEMNKFYEIGWYESNQANTTLYEAKVFHGLIPDDGQEAEKL